MAEVSITSALRVPKVYSGYAENVATERFQDHAFSVCPQWTGQDNLGREVPYFSENNLAAGCHDPSARMDIENDLRPSYHPYLNVQDGISGDTTSSFGGYDTLGVRRDESFRFPSSGNGQTQRVQGGRRAQGGRVSNGSKFYSVKYNKGLNAKSEQSRISKVMQRRENVNRYKKGAAYL